MATVRTGKRFHPEDLFAAFGKYADVSTNGVPLDDPGVKEITVSVKGNDPDPKTWAKVSQSELEMTLQVLSFNETKGQAQAQLDTLREKARKGEPLSQGEVSVAVAAWLKGAQ